MPSLLQHLPRVPRRLALHLAVLFTAALSLLTAAASPAHAVTSPVYKGTGWKAETAAGIYSLAPGPYVIVFADTTARTKLTAYFKVPAAQVTTSVGVKVTVTTLLDTTPVSACPARYRIVVHYGYRPMGTKGMSQALPCYNTGDGSAWGGHILMDSEYWTVKAWFSSNATVNESYKKDTATHELGHILGLDHANTDVDKDGVVENRECVKSKAGRKPVLCSTNRGTPAAADAGKYTAEYDLPGLRQLLANYTLRKT